MNESDAERRSRRSDKWKEWADDKARRRDSRDK